MQRLKWFFYRVWFRLRFVLTGDCGHACDWTQPYGWVPEADCPVHDVPAKEVEAIYAVIDGKFVRVADLRYLKKGGK